MELLLAIVAGVLYATGLYLMLRRRLAQLIIGLGLLSNGSNVLILSAAGVMRARPPLISEGNTTADQFADPVPQSLILTAIVIGFGVLAFALVLAHRVHQSAGSDDIDSIGPDSAKAPSDRPDSARAGLDEPDPA
jgi:multicomponent Na+:H+ antiporter subunit C